MQDINWEDIKNEMPEEYKGDVDLIVGLVRKQTIAELIEYLRTADRPVSDQFEYYSTALMLLKYLREKESK